MTKFKGDLPLSRRRIIKGAGVLAAGIAAPALVNIRSAHADYPDRPVKIVVANTPGGPSDLIGRVIAAALGQSTGKTFIIENIGGAGAISAWATSRTPIRMAIRSCSRPMRFRSM
jgi:tripartite-type tricarboxylate transporter receptor subunit TctC